MSFKDFRNKRGGQDRGLHRAVGKMLREYRKEIHSQDEFPKDIANDENAQFGWILKQVDRAVYRQDGFKTGLFTPNRDERPDKFINLINDWAEKAPEIRNKKPPKTFRETQPLAVYYYFCHLHENARGEPDTSYCSWITEKLEKPGAVPARRQQLEVEKGRKTKPVSAMPKPQGSTGVEVSGLDRKLQLLIDYGHYKSWTDLGNSFGASGEAAQRWGHGDGGRRAGTFPGRHYETLIEVLTACLPHGTSRAEVMELIAAPSAELEVLLQDRAQVSLNRIIEEEAQTTHGVLIPAPKANASLIETDQTPPSPKPEWLVRLYQHFRLEFRTDMKTGYASALQNAGKSWGPVSTHFDKKGGAILVPGLKGDGSLAHMWESQDADTNRFIILQTPDPPPSGYSRYLKDNLALDGTIIGRLAYFFSEQPKDRRRVWLLTVDVEA